MARISLMRVLAAAALVFPTSVLAVSPDEEPYFMGWYMAPDTTEAINCRTNEVHTTLSADRNYAACCATDDANCRIATACYGTTVLYNDNSTMECTSGNYCMSFSILQSYPNGNPSAVQLWCNTYWRAHTVYKEIPESTAATVTKTKTKTIISTITPASPASATCAGATETGSTEAVGSSAETSDDKPGAGASNMAWVAGAVIGPVAALGLIGLAFWYGRRRAMKGHDTLPDSSSGPAAAAAAGASAGAGAGADASSRGALSQPPMSSYQVPSGHPAAGPPVSSSYYFQQGGAGANQYYPGPPVQNNNNNNNNNMNTNMHQHQPSSASQQSYMGYWAGKDPSSSSNGSSPPPRLPTPASGVGATGGGVPASAYPPTTPGSGADGRGYFAPPSTIQQQQPWVGSPGGRF